MKGNINRTAVRQAKWIEFPECDPDLLVTRRGRLGLRIGMIIKALGLRRRGNDYPRVFGVKKDAIWKYRKRTCRPKVKFVVRLHRLEEIYAKEIKRMQEAERAYGGFKKIPTEILESLWTRANAGIKKD